MRLRPIARTDVKRDGADERWAPSRDQLRSLALYAAAALPYIVIGVLVNDFLLSPVIAFGYLLVVVWLIPTAVRWRRTR